MPFDSATYEIDPLTLTTPKARLEYLRDFLRGLPPERFDIQTAYGAKGYSTFDRCSTPTELLSGCGTTACIGGWAAYLWLGQQPAVTALETNELLGLSFGQAKMLMCPPGWSSASHTSLQAADVLDHLIRTGEVDWSVARKAEAV